MNRACRLLLPGFLLAATLVGLACTGKAQTLGTEDLQRAVPAESQPAGSSSASFGVEETEGSGPKQQSGSVSGSAGGPQTRAHPTPLATTDLPEGVSPALVMDAQMYAEQYGVELSEAITRLTLQNEIGELGAEIESKEAGTLAGFWIQNEPEYRVVVAFTRDGEATISKYVQDGPLLELIEVRTAQATLRDLKKAQKKASGLVHGLGFNIASDINVFENRVELYATDRAELEKALRENGKKLPDHVVIIGP
jgi:hypothetical protein